MSREVDRLGAIASKHRCQVSVDPIAPIERFEEVSRIIYNIRVSSRLEDIVLEDEVEVHKHDNGMFDVIEQKVLALVEIVEERRRRARGPMLAARGKALAFRAWAIDADDRLTSTGRGHHRWLPGAQRAVCKLPWADHQAPGVECLECGFYGLHDWRQAAGIGYRGLGKLIGAIACWGDTEIHAIGIRAEWAEIICLSVIEAHAIASPGLLERARKIAGDYGVPLVSVLELEEHARELCPQAKPVPKRDRPRDPDFDVEHSGSGAMGVWQMLPPVSVASAMRGASALSRPAHIQSGHRAVATGP